jgi:predicted alpha-1,2-mannosidase
MKTPRPAVLALAILLILPSAQGGVADVDVFIGTGGTGHTFPAATVPFGMVAPGPDSDGDGWSYSSGYQYRTPRLRGFSNTRISGAGIPELGDIRLHPSAGERWTAATTAFVSGYDKATETGAPGYYAVSLAESRVRVELTAGRRVAVHRYTFPEGTRRAQVLADFQQVFRFLDGPRVTASTHALDAARGEITGTTAVANWAEREYSFVVRFGAPILRAERLPAAPGEKAPRYLCTFELPADGRLEVRVALSTVDVAGARGNLAELETATFEQVRADATAAWAGLLGRVELDAPPEQRRLFYSALYRNFLHPSDIADRDGRVRTADGGVIAAPGGRYFSTLSLWDVCRATFPLQALLAPEIVDGVVATLLAHERAAGYLPIFTVWGRETWCMIGNPSLPVLAHALRAGFAASSGPAVLDAMVRTSTRPRPAAPAWAQRGWDDYVRHGYLPFDLAPGESVSKTLEYAWGDDAVARVAQQLGRDDVAREFLRRRDGHHALLDPETRTMRGRDSQGGWRTPFDPLVATSPLRNPGDYTEANAWQYTVTPGLFDPAGWVERMGGPRAAADWLDRFFTLEPKDPDKHLGQEGMIGLYAHGNEPSHHVAYLYRFTDRPERTAAWVERIARDFYRAGPEGLPGNDDAGQVSAWYVFATFGFYPVVPASGDFVLGRPLAPRITLRFPDGRTLRIVAGADGGSAATLDGRPVDPTALPRAALVAGGELRFGPP